MVDELLSGKTLNTKVTQWLAPASQLENKEAREVKR